MRYGRDGRRDVTVANTSNILSTKATQTRLGWLQFNFYVCVYLWVLYIQTGLLKNTSSSRYDMF